MKINISLSEPTNSYEFAGIILNCDCPNVQSVALNIEYRNLYEFTKLKSGIAFDLFFISCIVYGTDILIPRKIYGNDGWTRELELLLPVGCPNIFHNCKAELEYTLNFLTGDNWHISFEERTLKNMFKTGKRQKVYKDTLRAKHKVVNLFSGGMDSLIGAIDQLELSEASLCLVSHTDSMFKGAKKDQKDILELLRKRYKHFFHIPTRVDMSKHDLNGNSYDKETTLRSRSFLFLSMAVLVAEAIDKTMPVNIPENGTISLNYPLTPSRRSSCSTRTTHPHFISSFQSVLRKLELEHQVVNKYQLYTKGEMVYNCENQELLLKTYPLSCSCGKRGTRKDIRDNGTVSHCGVCMPCIYRRAALNKIKVHEIVGTDIFNSIKRPITDIPDMPALICYLRRALNLRDIELGLLDNGPLPLDQLNNYAQVVMRTRNELKEWIKENSNPEIQKLFGL
ncbi:MAG: hypothetical protein K2H63_07570 [Paramuribaculum sp.]|nr:hypothetical protein [Paramuribaculum sp.]